MNDKIDRLFTDAENAVILSTVLELLDQFDEDEYFGEEDSPYSDLNDAYDVIEKLRDDIVERIREDWREEE